MYSSVSFQQPELMDLDKEMEETQQFVQNGHQGAVAQDMEMGPGYPTEFEFIGQQNEEYEYNVLEDFPALQHPQMFNEEQENYYEDEL
ncbi:unnamed protein product [Caenorhabditis brenneri]